MLEMETGLAHVSGTCATGNSEQWLEHCHVHSNLSQILRGMHNQLAICHNANLNTIWNVPALENEVGKGPG